MGIKIPITQEYDDTVASENKRLMRGLENRMSIILQRELVKNVFILIIKPTRCTNFSNLFLG